MHDFLESQHRDEVEPTLATYYQPNIRPTVAGGAVVSRTTVGKVGCTYPHVVAERRRRSAERHAHRSTHRVPRNVRAATSATPPSPPAIIET
jgi:hypothetical protein